LSLAVDGASWLGFIPDFSDVTFGTEQAPRERRRVVRPAPPAFGPGVAGPATCAIVDGPAVFLPSRPSGELGSECPPNRMLPVGHAAWQQFVSHRTARGYRVRKATLPCPVDPGDGGPPVNTEEDLAVRHDRLVDPDAFAKAFRGVADEGAGGVKGVARRVSARLRRRGVLTVALARLGEALKYVQARRSGALVKDWAGWWTPDLASQSGARVARAFLMEHVDGATIAGSGHVRWDCGSSTAEGAAGSTFWVDLHLPGSPERVRVAPNLLAYLSAHVVFRERSVELLHGLRSRALQWARQRDCPWEHLALVLPGTVAVACLLSVQEQAAVRVLSTRAAGWAAQTSASVRAGEFTLVRGRLHWLESVARQWARGLYDAGWELPFSRPLLTGPGAWPRG
jgi:hypothetical protein